MKEGILEQQAEVGTHILDPARKIWNSKKLLKRLMISAWLLVLPNFMGIQSINYYSVTLFKQIGFEGDEASMYGTGFLGVMKFGCTAIYILPSLSIPQAAGQRSLFHRSSVRSGSGTSVHTSRLQRMILVNRVVPLVKWPSVPCTCG